MAQEALDFMQHQAMSQPHTNELFVAKDRGQKRPRQDPEALQQMENARQEFDALFGSTSLDQIDAAKVRSLISGNNLPDLSPKEKIIILRSSKSSWKLLIPYLKEKLPEKLQYHNARARVMKEMDDKAFRLYRLTENARKRASYY
jgi:hypothetical protein